MLQNIECPPSRVPSTPQATASLPSAPPTAVRHLALRRPVWSQPLPPRVVAQCGDVWHFFDARTVSRFWAADKYVCFCVDGTEHLLTEPLAALEARLGPWGFIRAHRSELVNLRLVRSVHRQDKAFLLQLADGQRVLSSRRLSGALRRHLTF